MPLDDEFHYDSNVSGLYFSLGEVNGFPFNAIHPNHGTKYNHHCRIVHLPIYCNY